MQQLHIHRPRRQQDESHHGAAHKAGAHLGAQRQGGRMVETVGSWGAELWSRPPACSRSSRTASYRPLQRRLYNVCLGSPAQACNSWCPPHNAGRDNTTLPQPHFEVSASSRRLLSTSCTYPSSKPDRRHYLARTDSMCGYFCSFTTRMLFSLMLRYWSTLCSVPVIARSFFSSTVTWGEGAHTGSRAGPHLGGQRHCATCRG